MQEQPDGAWVDFDAPLDLLPWGRNVYTVVYLDDGLDEYVANARTRRVEGRLDAVEVYLGVNRADVARGRFLYVGSALHDGWRRGLGTWWLVGYAQRILITSRFPRT